MNFAYNGPNWIEAMPGRDIAIGDVVSSYETILRWKPEMRAERGIVAIIESEIPAGKIATGSTIIDDRGQPRRSWVLEDEPPLRVPTEIHAAWLRAALAEADKGDAVDAAVASQGRVKQALWEYATTINRDDVDVVAIARALGLDLEALFKRADEIRAARQ